MRGRNYSVRNQLFEANIYGIVECIKFITATVYSFSLLQFLSSGVSTLMTTVSMSAWAGKIESTGQLSRPKRNRKPSAHLPLPGSPYLIDHPTPSPQLVESVF